VIVCNDLHTYSTIFNQSLNLDVIIGKLYTIKLNKKRKREGCRDVTFVHEKEILSPS
jgi:hypothetical protein